MDQGRIAERATGKVCKLKPPPKSVLLSPCCLLVFLQAHFQAASRCKNVGVWNMSRSV